MARLREYPNSWEQHPPTYSPASLTRGQTDGESISKTGIQGLYPKRQVSKRGWGLPLLSFTDSGLIMAQGFFPNKHIAYSDKVDKKKRWGLPFVQWMCLFSEGTIFTFGSNDNPALRHTQMALVSS